MSQQTSLHAGDEALSTFFRSSNGDLKKTHLTIGGLLLIGSLLLAALLGGFTMLTKFEENVSRAVTVGVVAHENKSVDRAHEDLSQLYVTKEVLINTVIPLDKKIDEVKHEQKIQGDKLDRVYNLTLRNSQGRNR